MVTDTDGGKFFGDWEEILRDWYVERQLRMPEDFRNNAATLLLELWGILALQRTHLVLRSNQIIFGDSEVVRSKVRIAGRFEQAIVFGRDCTISVCPGGSVVCSMEHDISWVLRPPMRQFP
jgi:hypothetical protein